MMPTAKSAMVLGLCLLTGTVASQQQQQQQQAQQPLIQQPSIKTASPMLDYLNPSINIVSPSFTSASPSFTSASPSFTSASPSFTSISPSLAPISAQPSFAPVGQVAFGGAVGDNGAGYATCAAIGRANIPTCAMDCFTTGAAALGCAVHDLGCQCRQQARMMAAAEGCVAEACPGAAYQRVIDGVMSMCGCAVGVATAEVSGFIARPGPTASVSGSYIISGSYSMIASMTVSNSATSTVTSSPGAPVDQPRQAPAVHQRDVEEEDHRPLNSFDAAKEAAIVRRVQAGSGMSSHHGHGRVVAWTISFLPTFFVGLIVY